MKQVLIIHTTTQVFDYFYTILRKAIAIELLALAQYYSMIIFYLSWFEVYKKYLKKYCTYKLFQYIPMHLLIQYRIVYTYEYK